MNNGESPNFNCLIIIKWTFEGQVKTCHVTYTLPTYVDNAKIVQSVDHILGGWDITQYTWYFPLIIISDFYRVFSVSRIQCYCDTSLRVRNRWNVLELVITTYNQGSLKTTYNIYQTNRSIYDIRTRKMPTVTGWSSGNGGAGTIERPGERIPWYTSFWLKFIFSIDRWPCTWYNVLERVIMSHDVIRDYTRFI